MLSSACAWTKRKDAVPVAKASSSGLSKGMSLESVNGAQAVNSDTNYLKISAR